MKCKRVPKTVAPTVCVGHNENMSTTQTPAPLITPDGDPIVAWGSYGTARGLGPLRSSRRLAETDVAVDHRTCEARGGYSDRALVAVDSDGVCWWMDRFEPEAIGGWAPTAGGSRAARYDASDLAAL